MSRIRDLITYECDRCARQQTVDVLDPENGFWCEYENIHTHGTITLCPSCACFFYDFMQGKGVKPI